MPELAQHVIEAAEKPSSRLSYRPKGKAAAAQHAVPMRFVADTIREQAGSRLRLIAK